MTPDRQWRTSEARIGKTALYSVACVLLAGCAQQAVFGGRSEARDALDTRELVLRWALGRYQPENGAVTAVCLRASDPYRRPKPGERRPSVRSTAYDPVPRLMARLTDVEPHIVPQSECDEDRTEMTEWVKESGERAWAVSVTYPSFDGPDHARVSVSIRENRRDRDGASCRLTRNPEWKIRECM